MVHQSRIPLLIGALLVLTIVLLIGLRSNPATAQEGSAGDMRMLFDNLTRDGGAVTILFDRPLVTGEGLWTLPDEANGRTISGVGADYVCFREPWNNSTRDRCTPFANITSVSYINP
jgi:hypothetical protein